MKALLISYGDWHENAIEVIELVDFSVNSLTQYFKNWAKTIKDFEESFGCSVDEIELKMVQAGEYQINVEDSVLSEFGYELLNLDKMLSLGEKILKVTDGKAEIVDGPVANMEELVYEFNETDYEVLMKHSGDTTYYKVVGK